MTETIIIHQMYKIEKITIRCIRFKKGSRVLLCERARDRAFWSFLKTRKQLSDEQSLYVRLVDQMVSQREIEEFIGKQNLKMS